MNSTLLKSFIINCPRLSIEGTVNGQTAPSCGGSRNGSFMCFHGYRKVTQTLRQGLESYRLPPEPSRRAFLSINPFRTAGAVRSSAYLPLCPLFKTSFPSFWFESNDCKNQKHYYRLYLVFWTWGLTICGNSSGFYIHNIRISQKPNATKQTHTNARAGLIHTHRCAHTPTQTQRTVPPAQLQHVPSFSLLDGCHGDVIDKVDGTTLLSAGCWKSCVALSRLTALC